MFVEIDRAVYYNGWLKVNGPTISLNASILTGFILYTFDILIAYVSIRFLCIRLSAAGQFMLGEHDKCCRITQALGLRWGL